MFVFFLLFARAYAKIIFMGKVLLKICAFILGSALFIPFSCTGGMIAGMFLSVELNARDLTHGEKPYSSFCVLALPAGENGPSEIVPLDRLDPAHLCGDSNIQPIETSQYMFLLPHPQRQSPARKWAGEDYTVTALSPEKQLIELTTYAEDYRFTNIYIAEKHRIEPLRSKVFGPGQMFQAAPFAFLFAFGLYGSGRWMRHVCKSEKTKDHPLQ